MDLQFAVSPGVECFLHMKSCTAAGGFRPLPQPLLRRQSDPSFSQRMRLRPRAERFGQDPRASWRLMGTRLWDSSSFIFQLVPGAQKLLFPEQVQCLNCLCCRPSPLQKQCLPVSTCFPSSWFRLFLLCDFFLALKLALAFITTKASTSHTHATPLHMFPSSSLSMASLPE